MVSFSCENCGDVLTKKKLDPHRNRCRGATFTCIDCMVHFPGTEYRSHTTCMTEDQKYQGALYKPKKQKFSEPEKPAATTEEPMAHRAYVEDVTEAYEAYRVYSDDEDNRSDADAPPEAPTPPRAVEDGVNVFDFLVDNTPNASNVNLKANDNTTQMSESTQLVRYDQEANGYIDESGYMVDEEDVVQYGHGPIPGPAYQTPAPKSERRKSKEGEVKKDKKRKRLHIETPGPLAIQAGDEVMTDAPPVLHSGLTGGLSRMVSVFPPSPDYSGGDAGGHSPKSPVKKTKHSKHTKTSKTESFTNGIKSLIGSSSKDKKVSKKRKSSTKKHHKHHHHTETNKQPKLIEYRPNTSDGEKGDSQVVLYKPRSEVFLSFVNKGPESEKGCSMNKALKRYHRERNDTGNSLGRLVEEKELWRSLRMRRNERGEIVLFCL